MHPLFNNKGYHLKYFNNEITQNVQDIKHPIIKEIFSNYCIEGVDFNSSSDVPSGTGLGSSSSFTTGLINLCNAYQRVFIKKEDIASEACVVEINKLGEPIGKQDQYAAAIGGMNYIQFNPDETVSVEKIHLSRSKKNQLEESLMLFYLGNSRQSSSILSENGKSICNACNMPIIHKMVALTDMLRNDLKNDCIENFGKILNDNWQYKKQLSKNISTPEIDELYDLAMNSGAQGGKLLGAGHTGFLLLYVDKTRQNRIRKLLNLYELPFRFDNSGTTIIY
jgi:D-glycero-alpha-D-manno-heptose-7-phosphate kinase